MDTKYIEMCKEAAEIQDLWEPQKGDISWNDLSQDLYILTRLEEAFGLISFIFWLPRQEDLQNIYLKEYNEGLHVSTMEKWFHDWFWEEYNNKQKDCCEQYNWNVLWLCFVEETCFNKFWNCESKKWELIK